MTELGLPRTTKGAAAQIYRRGVAAKLRNAFIGVSLFSLLAALTGIASYQVIEKAQNEVIDRSLPIALGAEQLALLGLSLVAATPELIASSDEALLERATTRFRLVKRETQESLKQLRRLGLADELLGLIESDLDTLFGKLERQADLLDQRNRLAVQFNELVERAITSAVRLLTALKPSIVENSANLLARSDDIRRDLLRPSGVSRKTLRKFEDLVDRDYFLVRSLTEMRFRAEAIVNHVGALLLTRDLDATLAHRDKLNFDLRSLTRFALEIEEVSLRREIGQSLQSLSAVTQGPTSLFHLRSDLIEVKGQIDELSGENRKHAESLQDRVNQLSADVSSLIFYSTQRARDAVTLGRIVLVIIALVAFAVAVFVSWRYVLRDVAGRIRRLAEITRDLAQGDIDVEIDVAGNDELGEMADAVRVFKANAIDLRHTNSELEQFAYVASHDLKAPLRGIANLASWIEQDLEEVMEGKTKQHLTLLQRRIGRMEALLEDLLAYSRVGRDAAELRTVDLEKTVPEIFNLVAPADRFRLLMDRPLPRFVTAQAPLELVFRNLIGNAVKHHDADRGSIEIGVRDLGESYEFQIRDDGPGVAIEYQEKIFAMFQTLRSRDEVEGSGMGLAMVKKIVESAGGVILVESDPNTKRGMSLRFTWPKNWRSSGSLARAA